MVVVLRDPAEGLVQEGREGLRGMCIRSTRGVKDDGAGLPRGLVSIHPLLWHRRCCSSLRRALSLLVRSVVTLSVAWVLEQVSTYRAIAQTLNDGFCLLKCLDVLRALRRSSVCHFVSMQGDWTHPVQRERD